MFSVVVAREGCKIYMKSLSVPQECYETLTEISALRILSSYSAYSGLSVQLQAPVPSFLHLRRFSRFLTVAETIASIVKATSEVPLAHGQNAEAIWRRENAEQINQQTWLHKNTMLPFHILGIITKRLTAPKYTSNPKAIATNTTKCNRRSRTTTSVVTSRLYKLLLARSSTLVANVYT